MYYVNPNIENLYRTSYQESRKDFIRLDMNENPEGLPSYFFEKVMAGITPEYAAMYPEMTSLIEKISNNLNFKVENICLTNGSDDAIRLLFEVFGEPGKKVVSVTPTFEMYSVYMKMYGLVHSPVNYEKSFDVNVSKVLDSIDMDTSIVVLLNPNSPIGAPWSESEIRLIIEKASQNNALVVIDEAYYYFSTTTFLLLLNEYSNVVIFRTFSKMLSIAGSRIGYVVSNAHLINMFKKASSTYPVNCYAIRLAEEILDSPQIVEELIENERKGRIFLVNQLQEFNYEYHFNEGNYVLIKSNKPVEVIFSELKQKKILIKTYKTDLLADWIRVTTGSLEIMRLFWDSFHEIDQS